MTNEYKFLNDGRKVIIIGQLNNVESIVQEIFITEDGDEIPSGERFTAKSLHDKPVSSYREDQEKKIKASIATLEDQRDSANRRKTEILEELKAYQKILKDTRILTEIIEDEEKLDIFTRFLSGTIEYLVVDSYTINPPIKMADAAVEFDKYYNGEKKFYGLKLFSVFGGSDGNITYNMSRYGDGSGGNTEVFPFDNREDALDHIKLRAIELIKKGHLSEKDWLACVGMGIKFDTETFETFYKFMRDTTQKNIDSYDKADAVSAKRREEFNIQLKKYNG